MRFAPENDDVYGWLVAELAHSIIPTTIMGLTIFGIGLFGFMTLGTPAVALACAFGSLASLVKIVLLVWQRRRQSHSPLKKSEATRWERGHACVTFAMAASVGGFAFAVFSDNDLAMQMLAVGLVFGYGSGIVSRVSVRPVVAVSALMLAVMPLVVAAALHGGSSQAIMAVVFFAFLLGAFESVRHHHRNAVRLIALRLDMAELARNDPLTGLRNRLGLTESFRTFARVAKGSIAVHCFDLDGFKSVNDRHGHPVGDALLCAIARRLEALLPPNSVGARIGGDEFVVLQAGLSQAEEAERLARCLIRDLLSPYELEDVVVTVGLSLGTAVSAVAEADLKTLIAEADAASYRAKRAGGGWATPASVPSSQGAPEWTKAGAARQPIPS